MPILNIQILATRPPKIRVAAARGLRGRRPEIAAPLSSVRIVLHEARRARDRGRRDRQAHGAGGRGADRGRDEAKKAALIAALNQAVCGAIGISGEDVRVLIRDVPKTDMGVQRPFRQGGRPQRGTVPARSRGPAEHSSVPDLERISAAGASASEPAARV